MASTAPHDNKGLSIVSKKWDTGEKGFLTKEEKSLRDLDTEGTGTLTAKQLATFADECGALRTENEQIKRRLNRLTVLLVVAFAAMIAAVIAAVLASRQTSVDAASGVMTASGSNSPVSTNTNEVELPIASLPFLPAGVARHVQTVDIAGPASNEGGSGYRYTRNVAAIDLIDSERLVVTTTLGDTLIWPSADGNEEELTVTLADGQTWDQPASCSSCAATNLLLTEENEQGVDAFLDRIGFVCRNAGGGRALSHPDHDDCPYHPLACDLQFPFPSF